MSPVTRAWTRRETEKTGAIRIREENCYIRGKAEAAIDRTRRQGNYCDGRENLTGWCATIVLWTRHTMAFVHTTVQLGVSRSTGLRWFARISRRPIGVETARRAATLPRAYRTLGLTPRHDTLPPLRFGTTPRNACIPFVFFY